MHSNLQAAYWFIGVLVAVIAVGLAALYTLKLRDIRRRQATEAYQAKHGDWFTYVLANLDGEEPLYPPPGSLKPAELRVIQDKLTVWIEQLRGAQQAKLIALCEQMGLVERQLKRLESPFEWVKLDAAYYLGSMRSHQAVPGMMKLLSSMRFSPMVFIVGRAIAKCARHTEELRDMVHLLLSHKKESQPLVADILAESDLDYSAMLETFLRGGDADRVRLALAAMQKHSLAGSGDLLFKLTASDNADIRLEASKLLLRDAAVVTEERARKLLAHPDADVRAQAAQALGRLGLKPCVKLLRTSLADSDWQVRYYSGKSLAKLGEEGFTALCEAAEEETGPVAETARTVIQEEMKSHESPSLGRSVEWVAVRDMQRFVYGNFFGQKELLSDR